MYSGTLMSIPSPSLTAHQTYFLNHVSFDSLRDLVFLLMNKGFFFFLDMQRSQCYDISF